jgi:hypothetical protein
MANYIPQIASSRLNEETALVEANMLIRSQAPKATLNSYGGPQKEYIEWCQAIYGNDQVSQERMLVFLQTNVIGREKRKLKRKKPSQPTMVPTMVNVATPVSNKRRARVKQLTCTLDMEWNGIASTHEV